MLSPERLFFLFIVALVVQPCISRITLPLRVSTIAKSLASSCGLGVGVDGSVIVSACYGRCIYKVMPSGPTTVVAGVLGACGFADGNGSKARFSSPVGVAIDADRNLAYVADAANNRIRVVDLFTYAVKTVAGSSADYRDGAFSAALFYFCFGLVLRTSTSQKVLYIADYSNGRIRKANFSSMMVSTVAVVPLPTFLDVLNDDQRLFVSSDNGAIYQILLANNNSAMILAGSAGVSGYVDAVGTAARFSQPRGVALSHDNAALFVGDLNNVRLRRIELSNRSVTTTAGTGAVSSIDGPLLSSTFLGFDQIMWHCQNAPPAECGLIVIDCSATTSNVRWVPITQGTQSMSFSAATQDGTNTMTASVTRSAQRLSATTSATHEASRTQSLSLDTWTRDASVTLSTWPSSSVAFSSSCTVSSTKLSASRTPTIRPTLSTTSPPSASMTLTPSPSLTSVVTTTMSPPTRSKSSTLFDCKAPQTTGVALAFINETVARTEMQLPFLRNSSTSCALGVSTVNASYPVRDDQNQNLASKPQFAFLTSQDVDRVILLQALPIFFNLTLLSPYQLVYYYVGNVTTVQGTNVSTWSVHPRSGVWHGVAVEAPSIGWLGDGVFPVLLYTELNLLVPLMCGDGQAMSTVVLTVPSPGVPRVLAAEVRRATQAALIVALLATGALSGSALGRVLATAWCCAMRMLRVVAVAQSTLTWRSALSRLTLLRRAVRSSATSLLLLPFVCCCCYSLLCGHLSQIAAW